MASSKSSNDDSNQKHDLKSIFYNKSSYNHFAQSFHPFHRHDLNCLFHVGTTGLGMWGAIQMAVEFNAIFIVYAYAAVIALTTPVVTALFHTAFVYGCLLLPVTDVMSAVTVESFPGGTIWFCFLTIIAGYGLQDLVHWLCQEPTMMSSYIETDPYLLIVHTLWLMPLGIDTVLMRHFFIPKLFVSRNRNIFCKVASRKAVEDLREWINQEVPEKSVSRLLYYYNYYYYLVQRRVEFFVSFCYIHASDQPTTNSRYVRRKRRICGLISRKAPMIQ